MYDSCSVGDHNVKEGFGSGGSDCRSQVWDSGFQDSGTGCRDPGVGLRILGVEFGVCRGLVGSEGRAELAVRVRLVWPVPEVGQVFQLCGRATAVALQRSQVISKNFQLSVSR